MEQALQRTDRASTVAATRMRTSFPGIVPGINAVRGAIAGLTSVLAVRKVIGYATDRRAGSTFGRFEQPLPQFASDICAASSTTSTSRTS